MARIARQRGFGLLEALVALVLISSVGFVLLAWVQQNIDTLQRLRIHYQELETRRLVQDWASALNPMEQPKGELVMGRMRVVWQAEQQGKTSAQSGYPMGTGLYDMAMFKVGVAVYREEAGEPWIREELFRVGYRKVRAGRGVF